MRKPRSLFARLAVWYGLILIAVLSIYSATVYYFAEAEDKEYIDRPETEEAEQAAQRRVLWAIGIGYPLALIISAAGGIWIARRELSPLEEIVRVAESMGADALDRRIPVNALAAFEVQRLVTVLNEMLERLQNALVGMQRFTADASHELRTPLTSLMGNLELALRRPRDPAELAQTIGTTLEELARTSQLIDSLLVLARSDAGQLRLPLTQLELGAIAARACEPYAVIAAERGLSLAVNSPAPLYARVDALWFGRAVANLVDNACKYTPRGGRIEVTVREDSSSAVLEVTDTGPGLSATDLERAFERFYRGINSRGTTEGFGLGLAITRDILRAMKGELTLESTPGQGTRARISLPKGEFL